MVFEFFGAEAVGVPLLVVLAVAEGVVVEFSS